MLLLNFIVIIDWFLLYFAAKNPSAVAEILENSGGNVQSHSLL